MSEHTPGPWKVMPCPIHKGKHILQDHRWIATENATVEYSPYVENDWGLSNGSLICKMRDTTPNDAKLIAAAPDLLKVCQEILKRLSDNENPNSQQWICSDALHPENDDKSIVDYVAEAIKKATE